MGNRVMKESVKMSEEIDALSFFEESTFYRLILTVDDYGVFPAKPDLLAHLLFPLKNSVDGKMMRQALEHMEKLNLIRLYRVKEKGEFLKIVTWEKHQRMRGTVRRFPAPEEADEEAETPETEAGAPEKPAKEPAKKPVKKPAAEPEKAPAAEPEKEPETAETVAEEPAPAEVRVLPLIELPLNDNSAHGVTREDMEEYIRLYPAVDVMQELRYMRGWCLSNPQKRKTKHGIRRFITGWLSRAQDRGGSSGRAEQPLPENPFIHMATEGGGEEASGREKASGGDLFEKLFAGGTVQ